MILAGTGLASVTTRESRSSILRSPPVSIQLIRVPLHAEKLLEECRQPNLSLWLADLSLEGHNAGKWHLNNIWVHTARLRIFSHMCSHVTRALMQLANCAHEMHSLGSYERPDNVLFALVWQQYALLQIHPSEWGSHSCKEMLLLLQGGADVTVFPPLALGNVICCNAPVDVWVVAPTLYRKDFRDLWYQALDTELWALQHKTVLPVSIKQWVFESVFTSKPEIQSAAGSGGLEVSKSFPNAIHE